MSADTVEDKGASALAFILEKLSQTYMKSAQERGTYRSLKVMCGHDFLCDPSLSNPVLLIPILESHLDQIRSRFLPECLF